MTRESILTTIRQIADKQGGKPPGKRAFENATGITEGMWAGKLWARWSDAVIEAGFAPNQRHEKVHDDHILEELVALCRRLGRIPTWIEIRLAKRQGAELPADNIIRKRWRSSAHLNAALREHATARAHADVVALLPIVPENRSLPAGDDGFVYLLRSGEHYKVGRSENVERRVKQVGIAMPDKLTLVHAIRTDDPPGIEAYWHRRFADRRANGEWFKLASDDVRAFKRRKFQ